MQTFTEPSWSSNRHNVRYLWWQSLGWISDSWRKTIFVSSWSKSCFVIEDNSTNCSYIPLFKNNNVFHRIQTPKIKLFNFVGIITLITVSVWALLSLIIKVWIPVFAHPVSYRLRIDILDTVMYCSYNAKYYVNNKTNLTRKGQKLRNVRPSLLPRQTRRKVTQRRVNCLSSKWKYHKHYSGHESGRQTPYHGSCWYGSGCVHYFRPDKCRSFATVQRWPTGSCTKLFSSVNLAHLFLAYEALHWLDHLRFVPQATALHLHCYVFF